RIDATIRLAADVEAVRDEELLQLIALGAGEHALVARPRLDERRIAAQPVGEMADRHRISLCRVVAHDHAEIGEHQEGGPARAGRQQQKSLVAATRKLPATDTGDAAALPV